MPQMDQHTSGFSLHVETPDTESCVGEVKILSAAAIVWAAHRLRLLPACARLRLLPACAFFAAGVAQKGVMIV